MIPAGKRTAFLTFQRNGATANADGQPAPASWEKLFDAWGAMETGIGNSRESWNAFRSNETLTHVVTIDYAPGRTNLLATDRVLYTTTEGVRTFNIAGPPVNREERNIDLMVPIQENLSPTP